MFCSRRGILLYFLGIFGLGATQDINGVGNPASQLFLAFWRNPLMSILQRISRRFDYVLSELGGNLDITMPNGLVFVMNEFLKSMPSKTTQDDNSIIVSYRRVTGTNPVRNPYTAVASLSQSLSGFEADVTFEDDVIDLAVNVAQRQAVLDDVESKLSAIRTKGRRLEEQPRRSGKLEGRYLPNLHMDIVRCPIDIGCIAIAEAFRTSTLVEGVWQDEVLEGFDDNKELEGASHLPTDAYINQQWALVDEDYGVQAETLWSYWKRSGLPANPPPVIGLIDSGVDYRHPDLEGRIWVNPEEDCSNGIDDDGNGYIDDCMGWNFIMDSNDPLDDNGHGTAAAGIIAAKGNNGVGIAPLCWSCQVLPLKALDANIKGTVKGFVRALDYAITKRVKITTNSYGGRNSSFAALETAVRRTEQSGMIFVAAAGNYDNDNDKQPTYPASYPYSNVISVAAIRPNGYLSRFSSWGKTTVHIAAPGEQVLTTHVKKPYKKVDGTSFAVPYVAAATALVWQEHASMGFREVIDRILETGKQIPGLKNRVVTGATLDAAAAVMGEHVTRPCNDSMCQHISKTPQEADQCNAQYYVDGEGRCVKRETTTPEEGGGGTNASLTCNGVKCTRNAVCQVQNNVAGCVCSQGFGYKQGMGCVDIDECSELPFESTCGGETAYDQYRVRCVNVPGSFNCVCAPGYQMSKRTRRCIDINECQVTPWVCPSNSKCVNLPGTFDCVCPAGSVWNGSTIHQSTACIAAGNPITGKCSDRNNPCQFNELCYSRERFTSAPPTCQCRMGYVKSHVDKACVRPGVLQELPSEVYFELIKESVTGTKTVQS